MNSQKKNPKSGSRSLGIFLCLCILLLPGWSSSVHAFLPTAGLTALVQVKLDDESKLASLESLSLPVYTRFYPAQNETILVLAADSELQQALSSRGYPVELLDPDIQGASYYLLSGAPENLQRARSLTSVLLVVDRQAVARVDPDSLDALAGIGLRLLPLVPRPLVVPGPSLSAPELPGALTPNPLVQEMVSKVSTEVLSNYVGSLSGEWGVTIGGLPYEIDTRYTYADQPMTKVTHFAHQFFESLGLPTGYHDYSFAGEVRRNVIAEQTGLTQPNKIYLLIAHLDDTSYVNGSPMTLAPGADDNASGSAALMHIASILRQYEFGCTLRYALVTGEEQGLYGSHAYATAVHASGDNLKGVLNLDMLGYNSAGTSPTLHLVTRQYSSNNQGDLLIANLFYDTVSAYSIQLDPIIYKSGETGSDHASFWTYGYPAILAIEDWNDHTPYYHRKGDKLSTLNMDYYTEFVKASIATFAHMGCLLDNQLSGTVTDSSSGVGIAGATVEAWQNGAKVRSTTTKPDGAYSLPLSAGNYSIVVFAYDHLTASFSDVPIVLNQVTPLDVPLQGCTFVRGAAIQASTVFPDIGQTVFFTATITGGEMPISYTWNFSDSSIAAGMTVSHTFSAQGTYPVVLTTNNACLAPQNVMTPVFVETQLYFLPVQMKNKIP